MVKIYFCGSIRGGRELADVYREIVIYLQNKAVVLTEHVGNEAMIREESKRLSDNELYRRDMKWLQRSDLVVAEVTVPSLGVGYEIGFAVSAGKPVLCLFNPDSGRQLSAMISGCSNITVARYQSIPEAEEHIQHFMVRNAPGRKF